MKACQHSLRHAALTNHEHQQITYFACVSWQRQNRCFATTQSI